MTKVIIEKLESDKYDYSITTTQNNCSLTSWVDFASMCHTDVEYFLPNEETLLYGVHFLAVSDIIECISKGYAVKGYDSDVLDGLLDVRYIVKGFNNET